MIGSSPVLKVLLIEDEAAIRLVCRVNLEADGLEVVEAPDGPTGLELARRERPDAVLVDVLLPGLDGWQVAEALVSDAATSAIPVVFLTALVHPAGEEPSPALVLVKPFDPTALAALVQEVVAAAARGERAQLTKERIGELRARFDVG